MDVRTVQTKLINKQAKISNTNEKKTILKMFGNTGNALA